MLLSFVLPHKKNRNRVARSRESGLSSCASRRLLQGSHLPESQSLKVVKETFNQTLSMPNTKSSLLLYFGGEAQASRLCASSCCLGSMNASTLISLYTAETAMPPSCAMQSPISKRHWYKRWFTSKAFDSNGLNADVWNPVVRLQKERFIPPYTHCFSSKQTRQSAGFKERAFTLVELLVVIAIVAILAAVALPIVGSFRAKGQQSKCAANLKQIGAAFSLWAADNNGVVKSRDHSSWINGPDGSYPRSWVSNLNPYLMQGVTYNGTVASTASVFRCPVGKSQEWNGVSYAANIYLGGFRDPDFNQRMSQSAALYNPRRIVSCLAPSKCIIVVDGRCKAQGFLDFDAGGAQTSPPMDRRHNNGVNALFADGHVEWINPLTISATEYNEKFCWKGGALWPASGQ